MVLQSGGNIAALPPVVLAQILQKVDPAEALQCYALTSRAWNEAAALSIGSISIKDCTQVKADAVSQWLQTHGPNNISNSLAVESFTIVSWPRDKLQLLIPMQHLKALRHLQLRNATVSRPGAPAPVLDPVSCALLTSLVLDNCQVGLQGLPALTGLQQLSIEMPSRPQDAATTNAAIVAEAIPQLRQLTSLQLGGPASQDTALAHLSRLTVLQQLQLTDTQCTSASLLQLPSSLTKVSIKSALDDEEPEEGPSLRFSSTDSPGLCQLTTLQELTLYGGFGSPRFHVEMLSTLTTLKKLSVSGYRVMAGFGEPTLVLLTCLKGLQHLGLHSFCEDEDSAPAVTPADYAALTSSQQLTHLDLTHDPGPEHAAVLFPAQHQLPKLQSLALGIQWLEDAEVLGRIITCCPNLQALKVNSYGGADVSDIDSAVWAASSSRLTALSELTTLQLMMLEVSVGADVGAALAALTGLRELSNDTMNSEDVPALQQLTACQQLTMLYVESMSFGESPSPADDGVLIVNQAPDGAPPDVWQRIPSMLPAAAAE